MRTDVLERLQHYMASTPPAKRCPCGKGVVLLQANHHLGSCDAKYALIRKESELMKVEEGDGVLNRKRLDSEERVLQANAAEKRVDASWREPHAPNLSSGFLVRLKTFVVNELLYRCNG